MDTPSRTSERLSKPQTNSPMMRSTRQGSETMIWALSRRSWGWGPSRRVSSSVGRLLSSMVRYGLLVIRSGIYQLYFADVPLLGFFDGPVGATGAAESASRHRPAPDGVGFPSAAVVGTATFP